MSSRVNGRTCKVLSGDDPGWRSTQVGALKTVHESHASLTGPGPMLYENRVSAGEVRKIDGIKLSFFVAI